MISLSVKTFSVVVIGCKGMACYHGSICVERKGGLAVCICPLGMGGRLCDSSEYIRLPFSQLAKNDVRH